VLGTARIPDLPLQPTQGLGGVLEGPLPGCPVRLDRFLGVLKTVAPLAEQQHQGRSQLLGGPSGALALEGMPVAIADAQAALQLLRQLAAARRPGNGAAGLGLGLGLVLIAKGCLHCRIPWTGGLNLPHPGAMSQPSRRPSPRRPLLRRPLPTPRGRRLLHNLGDLHSLAAAPVAPAGQAGRGSAQRRRRQHLALAQRLLDPLPPALLPPQGGSELFWRMLRWGGLGLLLSRLLAG